MYLGIKKVGNIKEIIEVEVSIEYFQSYKNFLVIGTRDKSLKFYDLKTKALKLNISKVHEEKIKSFLIIKNTDIIAVCAYWSDKVFFWNILNFKLDSEIDNHSRVKSLIQFDENTLIVESETINFYEISSKKLLRVLNIGNTMKQISLINLNEKLAFIFTDREKYLNIWNENRLIKSKIRTEEVIESIIQLKVDKNILISIDNKGNLRFWSINHEMNSFKIFFRSDYYREYNDELSSRYCLVELPTQKLVVLTSDLSIITFWNTENYEFVRTIRLKSGIERVIFSNHDQEVVFNIGSDIYFLGN